MAEMTKRITIIGLGLIGGSLGLAMKRAGVRDAEIVGYDVDHGVARTAEKMGAIDRAEGNLGRAVDAAALVVIATPILAVPDVMQGIAAHLATGAVVTDTASTKAHVMNWAKERLPATVDFIGGHPMAGKAEQGIANADAELFTDRAYCLCPPVDADPSAIRTVTGLANLVGAVPLYMDADEHDQYAAAISHLPLMMSTALFTMARSSPSWEDLGAMASAGFRDMTRLASGDVGMSHGIWRTNREALVHWLERMMAELGRFRDMLQDAQDEQLLTTFGHAQAEREVFLQQPVRREPRERLEVDGSKAFMDMLVGGWTADNLRKAQKMPELMRETPPETNAGTELEPGEARKRMTIGDKIAEGIRRDLEKLERQRAQKEAKGAVPDAQGKADDAEKNGPAGVP